MAFILKSIAKFLPFAVLITLLSLFIYVAVQQVYRQNLNDPQIAFAEDAALALSRGAEISSVVPTEPLDMENSLKPWIAVYDEQGTPLASSGLLHGGLPKLPQSLFDTTTWRVTKTWRATTGAETRVTWEPQEGTRQAVVLVHYSSGTGNGFVASGRSMSEIEERITLWSKSAFIGWAAIMGSTFLTVAFLTFFNL